MRTTDARLHPREDDCFEMTEGPSHPRTAPAKTDGDSQSERVKLKDGSEILIRPIGPADREMLLAGFHELSSESRYRRFFTPLARLDARWLTYLTSVDHHDHEALIAESVADHQPVGVARFVRLPEQPTAAEVAVTVVDEWQGRGAASALLVLLSGRARSEGITRFHATCLAENHAVLELFRVFSTERTETAKGNIVEIDLDLPTKLERGSPLHTALSHAAAGGLHLREQDPGTGSRGAGWSPSATDGSRAQRTHRAAAISPGVTGAPEPPPPPSSDHADPW